MDQSCCHNEQRNAPGYFPGWLDTTTLLLSQEEHTDFSLFAGTFGSHGIWSRAEAAFLRVTAGGCSFMPERNAHGFICLFLTKATLLKCLHFLKAQALAY